MLELVIERVAVVVAFLVSQALHVKEVSLGHYDFKFTKLHHYHYIHIIIIIIITIIIITLSFSYINW